MDRKKLLETKPGTILVLPGKELEIVRVSKYKGSTFSVVNLVALAATGREIVLETEDRMIRVWLEISELLLDAETRAPITGIDADIVIMGSSRFELWEGPSRAKTISITAKGTEEGKLRFSVFCPEGNEDSEERICVEDKGGRLVVYHSVGFVPIKEIRVK